MSHFKLRGFPNRRHRIRAEERPPWELDFSPISAGGRWEGWSRFVRGLPETTGWRRTFGFILLAGFVVTIAIIAIAAVVGAFS
jgi:hypothetical protein